MSRLTTGGPGSPADSTPGHFRRRPFLPFWLLQVTELVIAVVFVDLSIHVGGGGMLVGAAVACFALAVTAQGPLGIVRICGQSLHLVLAVVTGVVVAVAPVIPALRPDLEGIIVLEFGALGLIRMATFTAATTATTATAPGGPGSRYRWPGRPDAAVIDAHATAVEPPHRPPAGPPRGNGGPHSSQAAARWAGQATGAAAAAGKQAAARYGPVAEASAKRTIRSAGRVLGRAAARAARAAPGDRSDGHRDDDG
jgi:hypothetical protein